MKTVEEIINLYKSSLAKLYDAGELNTIVALVFNDAMALSRTDLVLKKKEAVSADKEKILLKYLDELATNKPIQYVLGYAWFFGLKMTVNEHVLIPRPETEELVKWILEIRNTKIDSSHLKILDIGTGSGCIAVALKDNLPDSDVYCMDMSEAALKVAKANAELNGVSVTFIQGDILKTETGKQNQGVGFDIIVSNPPYVLRSEAKTLTSRETDFEPHRALFVDDNSDNGLIFYRRIAEFAKMNLVKKGYLFFEINETKGDAMIKLLTEAGYKDIELKKDMSGKDRMVMALKGK